jgi:hypothetical protein
MLRGRGTVGDVRYGDELKRRGRELGWIENVLLYELLRIFISKNK